MPSLENGDSGFSGKLGEYRYLFLALSMVALLVFGPLLQNISPLVTPFLFLFVMIAVFRTIRPSRRIGWLLLALIIIGFGCHLANEVIKISTDMDTSAPEIIRLADYTLYFGLCIVLLVTQIFSERKISLDTIRGGIAVYFIIGLEWALFYQILLQAEPSAISLLSNSTGHFSELLYFSFTTLTTLGYGDISPVSWMARNLTILESTLGQVYLTVLVARLVGLHISGKES